MTWYKTGTVSVTPGSNAVIGKGTAFIANSRVGDGFRGPDGGWYEVTNIASDTALSISPPYGDPSAYALAPLQGYVKDSADALRAATQVIASVATDVQEQVDAATEAAESAEQSKVEATEQAEVANAAADLSTENREATEQLAQQSQASAQASGAAADRAETARDSIIQSEQAAAASAAAAAESAEHAEEVTLGKAASGENTDITSLGGLTTALSIQQGGTGNNTGLAASATKLATARTIDGVAFDGSQDITTSAGAIVRKSTNTSLPSGSVVWLTHDIEVFDSGNMADLATDDSYITIRESGMYLISCAADIAAGATVAANSIANLRVSAFGGSVYLLVASPWAGTTANQMSGVSTAFLPEGTRLQMGIFQNTGAVATSRGTPQYSQYFGVARIG